MNAAPYNAGIGVSNKELLVYRNKYVHKRMLDYAIRAKRQNVYGTLLRFENLFEGVLRGGESLVYKRLAGSLEIGILVARELDYGMLLGLALDCALVRKLEVCLRYKRFPQISVSLHMIVPNKM